MNRMNVVLKAFIYYPLTCGPDFAVVRLGPGVASWILDLLGTAQAVAFKHRTPGGFNGIEFFDYTDASHHRVKHSMLDLKEEDR